MIHKIIFSILFSSLAIVATCNVGYCEDFFDDPEEDDGGDVGDNLTVIDLAVIAFDNQVYGKCECNSDNTSQFEKCAGKLKKKAMTAFKPAAKFNQESVSDLKQALNDEIPVLVEDCANQGDDEEGGDDDLPDEGDDF